MVLFRYPPTGASASQRGCGAHTDCGFLTIVAQDEPGIEVQLADGTWFPAPSLPGSFLVNLGDLAQRWTGDAYRSTVHRVVNRSATSARHSIVFFCNADFDTQVETIEPTHTAAAGGGDGRAASGAAALVPARTPAPPSDAAAAAGGGGGGGECAAGSSGGGSGVGPRDGGHPKEGFVRYPAVKAGEYILQKLGLMTG